MSEVEDLLDAVDRSLIDTAHAVYTVVQINFIVLMTEIASLAFGLTFTFGETAIDFQIHVRYGLSQSVFFPNPGDKIVSTLSVGIF